MKAGICGHGSAGWWRVGLSVRGAVRTLSRCERQRAGLSRSRIPRAGAQSSTASMRARQRSAVVGLARQKLPCSSTFNTSAVSISATDKLPMTGKT